MSTPYNFKDVKDENGYETSRSRVLRHEYNLKYFLQNWLVAQLRISGSCWVLKRCSDVHFQIRNEKCIINLYPTKFRIWTKDKIFLKVKSPWTALDIATAAIRIKN